MFGYSRFLMSDCCEASAWLQHSWTRTIFETRPKRVARSSSLDSGKPEAWFKLGHEYLDLYARLAFRGARLYREPAWGHRFLGDLLFQRNRPEDALKEYQKRSADPRQVRLVLLL